MISCWTVLGINPTEDKRLIKRVYSTLLKKTKPETDPEGYQTLREAFDQAIKIAKNNASTPAKNINETKSSNDGFDNHIPVKPLENSDKIFKKSPNQEILIRQQHEATLLEKQRMDDDKKRKQQEAQNTRIKKLVDKIFSSHDFSESINQFDKLIASEEFININYRRKLDEQCFKLATSWPQEKDFPGKVFKTMAEEFSWFQSEAHRNYDQNKLEYLSNRLRAHEKFVALQALAARRAWGKEKSNIYAARILLSEFSKGRFLRITVLGSHYEALKNAINTYQLDVENGFLPELDTPTFRWWIERFKSHYFGMAHLLGGIITGVVIVSLVFNKLEADGVFVHPTVFIGVLISSTITGSAIFWGLGWLSSKGWKKVVNFYKEHIRYRVHNPKTYNYLTAIYLTTFIIPIFLADFSPIQLLGYGLVFITLGTGIIFFLISGAAYEISMTVMQLDTWSEVIPTDFALAGLLIHYLFFRAISASSSKLTDRITGNGILLLLLYITFSILAAIALLKGAASVIDVLNA